MYTYLLFEAMQKQKFLWALLVFFFCVKNGMAQPRMTEPILNPKTQFSLGARSTLSAFDGDGAGIGTGGQFRIQINKRVNTDWFADYITISANEGVRSTYYHVGWSVLFYPINYVGKAPRFQPYILAGHCFDYNRKTVPSDPSIQVDRWGSAVQAGIGLHYNITQKLDLSLTSQYMIHLTKELDIHEHNGTYEIHEHSHNGLQGHVLTTLSLNYKLFQLWDKK